MARALWEKLTNGKDIWQLKSTRMVEPIEEVSMEMKESNITSPVLSGMTERTRGLTLR